MTKLQAHFHAAQMTGYSDHRTIMSFKYTPKFKGEWCIEATQGACLIRTIYSLHA